MSRRLLDVVLAAAGLAVLAVPLSLVLVLVWQQDWRSPFFVADRVGRHGRRFRMIKVRSMVVGADHCGVESTSANDPRITAIGHFVRRWKIDELSQLWNVFIGDMSLVGPRPNTLREVDQYSAEERQLLSMRPGITDFASIVFSDEGEILRGSSDPDRDYAELIWPWKSRLSMAYVLNASVPLYLRLVWLTLVAIFDKRRALDRLDPILARCGCDEQVREVAARRRPLGTFAHVGRPKAILSGRPE